MSDNSLATRLRRIEATVAFAADTWGLPHSQLEGLRAIQRELVESTENAEQLERLRLRARRSEAPDDVDEPPEPELAYDRLATTAATTTHPHLKDRSR